MTADDSDDLLVAQIDAEGRRRWRFIPPPPKPDEPAPPPPPLTIEWRHDAIRWSSLDAATLYAAVDMINAGIRHLGLVVALRVPAPSDDELGIALDDEHEHEPGEHDADEQQHDEQTEQQDDEADEEPTSTTPNLDAARQLLAKIAEIRHTPMGE